MKKNLLPLILALLACFAGKAQTFNAAWAARFQQVLDSVNTVNHNLVGVTAAVYMPGQGLWTGVAGPSLPGIPMNKGMRVMIGSNSKLFMAATMLKLQEQHLLSLNDHIGRWIHIGLHNVDTTATIRQLLSHESGIFDVSNDRLDDYINALVSDTSHPYTAKEMVDSIGAPFYAPGHGYHYSGTNYIICTMIIQAATGQSYAYNLRNLVLNPLQMDSTFIPLREPAQPMASFDYYGYKYYGWGYTSLQTASTGASDIASTPQEMVEWYSSLFDGRLLADSSLRQLEAIDPASMYGLGIQEQFGSHLGGVYYHTGWQGGFTSVMDYDKDTKACFFVAINTYNDSVSFAQYSGPIFDVFVNEMPKQAADAGITAILSPTGITCNASVKPVVTLTNSGSSILTSATIKFSVDGSLAGTTGWSGSLAPGASTNVTLNAAPIANSMHHVKVYTTLPNGVADGYSWNDTFSTRIGANLATPYSGYFSEGFEGATTPVLIWNTHNGMEGQAGVTKLAGHASTHSIGRDCYDNGDYGNVSNIDMPAVHLSAGSSPVLSFSYAYSVYPGSADSLEALISTNCGASWTSLFHKGGAELSPGDSSYSQYYPQAAAEWKTQSVPLSTYSGDVLIRFRQFNGNGNNIFLDDIVIGTPTDVAGVSKPQFTMYPNPARETVTVTGLPANTAYRLTDLSGRVLADGVAVADRTVLDINRFAPGMYLLSTPYGALKVVKE